MASCSDKPEDQPLQPSPTEIDAVYSSASRYWSSEARSASDELESGFDFRGLEPRQMLGRVPPLPDRTTCGLSKSSLLSTKWRVTGPQGCDVSGKPIQMPPIPLRLQLSSPINVSLTGHSFSEWREWKGDHQPNFLAVSTFAWSYILTARLLELQGSDRSFLSYTDTLAPIYRGNENHIPVDVGSVDSATLRWFRGILAPGVGFQATLNQEDAYSCHAPWIYSLTEHVTRFSIECKEDYDRSDDLPLTSYQALQSLIDFGNRLGVSKHQLHAALATALLFPTLRHLNIDPALPPPAAGHTNPSPPRLGAEDMSQLFEDLPYYITLSCGGDVVNSSLCGVFWNPHIPSNFVSPWLQPLLDLEQTETYQSAPGHYAETLAVIGARRAPNLAYLSLGAAISGLTSKILDQVLTGKPPLERHAFAWTGVPQSFMDLAGEGRYLETHLSTAYIQRSDCWRLRKLPPSIDDDLHYGNGPFTPWAPPGSAPLKNCPLRVQVHKHCDRHSLAYEGLLWSDINTPTLESDFGRNTVTPHIFRDRPFEDFHSSRDLRFVGDEETSIEATRASFRWVLDNGEGRPLEDAYKDAWLVGIGEEDSESEVSSDDNSATDVKLGAKI